MSVTFDYCQDCYDIEDKVVIAYKTAENKDGEEQWYCKMCLENIEYKQKKETVSEGRGLPN